MRAVAPALTAWVAFFATNSAFAADRVFTSGDPAAAIQVVATRSGVSAAALQPATLADLLATKSLPVISPQGRLEGCVGVAFGHELIVKSLAEAEGDVLYMEYGKVSERLQKVTSVLPCLNQIISSDELSRIWFLLGFTAAMEGRADAARVAYGSALAAKADLAWDPNFPAQAQAPFDAVRAEQGVRSRLVLVPLEGLPIRLNGQLVKDFSRPLFVAPGAHLIQVGNESVVSRVAHLEPERSHLLALSGTVDPSVLSWAADPERQNDLQDVFALALPAGERVFVVNEAQVFEGRVAGPWAALAPAAGEADQRSAELRDAAKSLRVSSPVGFYSPELDLWVTPSGGQRTRVSAGQAVLLPLGRSAVEAQWGELRKDFPLDVVESATVLAALRKVESGSASSPVISGPGLPLPWGLAVHANGETVLRDLYPGTQSEAFVALDLKLEGADAPVHVAGTVLGMPGAVRTLQLDPGRHPAVPLLDAVKAARSIKRKDVWVAPAAIAAGAALGGWSAYSAILSEEAAAEARDLGADVELVEQYEARAGEAQSLSDQAWAAGIGSALAVGFGVTFELTIGGDKRRKVAAAWDAYDTVVSEAVPIEQLLVEWK